MTTVYLIRHAEAEGNVYRRCHGHYNSLVTARGLLQIAELAERFRSERVDAVYSSDLYRTMKTASAVFEPHNLPLITDARLREIGMGVWEDLTFGDLQRYQTEQLVNLTKEPKVWTVEDAETLEDVRVRMTDFMEEMLRRHENKTIAVFSHGMAIRSFTDSVFDKDAVNEHPDNTAVTKFEYENGEYRLVYHNDNSHLSEGNSTLARQKWVRDERGYDDANLVFEESESGVYTVFSNGEECGILELDKEMLANEGIGVVTRYKLREGYRGGGLGIQLLGQAVSDYRNLGRRRLRILLTDEFLGNTGFFEKLGFVRVSPGVVEMDIFIPHIASQ